MITISLCMIVKNEEKVLGRCLNSVADAVEEIILVDTGSTDATKQIARTYTDRVFDFAWIDDFAAARNYAFSLATCEYQLWLDADDVLPQEEKQKLLALKQTLSSEIDIVTMKYHTHLDAKGNPILTSRRERLLRRAKNYQWQDPVHECIPLAGHILHSDIAIVHQKEQTGEALSLRNLRIYQKLEAAGRPMTPRQLYYYARELKDHQMYEKAAQYFERFLETGQGMGEDAIAACYSLGLCYRSLGQSQKVVPAFCQSFQYGTPRAEIFCEMGYHFQSLGQLDQAAHWFALALTLPIPDTLGFLLHTYWRYIPHLQLSVYYYGKGDLVKAAWHNEQAGLARPGDAIVQQNAEFYEKALAQKRTEP